MTADTNFKTSGSNGTTFATNSKELSGTGKLKLTGNMRNTGSWSYKTDVSVTGNVTDNGTWTSADGKKLIFNGTGEQSFIPVAETTYKIIEVNKSAGSFSTASDKNLKVTTFTLTACPETTFNGESTFTAFDSDAAAGNITPI